MDIEDSIRGGAASFTPFPCPKEHRVQLRLFPDLQPHSEAVWAPPLCPVPDTTYRCEVRFLWNPLAHRGTCAVEVTDDDTRELIAWELRPGAHSIQDLSNDIEAAVQTAMASLLYLDEPF